MASTLLLMMIMPKRSPVRDDLESYKTTSIYLQIMFGVGTAAGQSPV